MTAAASKYSGGAPSIRNASGSCSGNSSATVLASHAAPVPSAISVNMLSFAVTIDVQPRTKNGHPHHSTTGVASSAWDHPNHTGPSQLRASSAGAISLIATARSGTDSAHAMTSLRRMSTSSGLGRSSGSTALGSRSMPHSGQLPGASRTTPGCIGHTNSVRAGAGACASSAMPHSGHSDGTSLRTSGWQGQVYTVAPPAPPPAARKAPAIDTGAVAA